MPWVRLIYFSENHIDPAEGSTLAQLSTILSVSNRNNKAAGITGALLFDRFWFVQLLEGDREKVWQTFKRISDDERHGGVVLVEMAEISERLFENWWMRLTVRNQETEPFFAAHSKSDALDVRNMSAAQMRDVITSLAQRGFDREPAPLG